MNLKKLKILCLDDVIEDADLIIETLKKDGLDFEFDYVSDEVKYNEKLKSNTYDIILSDYNLPGFSGIAALFNAKKHCPQVPFICVSGTIGEDLAVELMHLGAADYIIKNKLSKLPIAIGRALKEAEEHNTRMAAELSLIESEARFRDIILSSNDWVWEIDSNWKYCYTSETIANILGYSNAEVIGKSPFDFMSREEKEKVESAFSQIARNKEKIKDLENWNLRKDGHRVCLQTNGVPVLDKNGNLTGYRGVDKDITERKKLEEDLLEAKFRAEASDKLKTAFLNNISHEVRTPLNGILGFAEFIVQPGLPQEEKDSYLQILNESSDRLVNTITNYMDMSLIVSGNMSVKYTPVDLPLFLEKVYKKFLPECKTKNLEFVKEIPISILPPLAGDEVLLEKVFSHLLNNAIKFTQNGNITLGISFNNREFEIFVTDTGSGIDPASQSTVFQIFTQADVKNTRGYEGSGLGLSIAKGLVELMGGKIRMESEMGNGTSFYLTFPDAGSQSSGFISPDRTEAKLNKRGSPVILLAEDDESNATLLGVIFDKASIKFLIAKNGMEAVDLCLSHPEISLVLMDIKMPLMDGLIATRKIKEFRKNLPIIGVTAYAMTRDKEKALEAGCDEYLTKPLKPDLLLETIKSLL